MLRTPTLIVCVTALSLFGACREDDTPHAPSKEQSSRISPSETSPAPQWTATHIAVHHFKSAATAITCDGGFGTTGWIACGPSELATEVSWQFLGRISNADEYEVTQVTRLQEESTLKTGPVTRSKTTKVLYKGTKVVIFEDDQKRVTLYPETDRSGTASGEVTEAE